MNREEAFRLLGLAHDASTDEIRRRFNQLAHDLHPDKGGDGTSMAHLYEARQVALGRASSLALVPIDEVKSLVASEVAAVATRYESQERKRRALSRIKIRRESTLRRARRVVGLLGVIAGVLALFTSNLLPLVDQEVSQAVKGVLIGLTFLSGIVFLLASQRADNVEREVEDLSSALADKNFYLKLMEAAIPPDRRGTWWSEYELEKFLRHWAPPFTHLMEDLPFRSIRQSYANVHLGRRLRRSLIPLMGGSDAASAHDCACTAAPRASRASRRCRPRARRAASRGEVLHPRWIRDPLQNQDA